MNFNFRLADDNDLSDIMELMNQTRDTICPKVWFVDDTEDSVRHSLAGNGFIILAMPQHSEEMAGFFIINFPKLFIAKNMIKYIITLFIYKLNIFLYLSFKYLYIIYLSVIYYTPF